MTEELLADDSSLATAIALAKAQQGGGKPPTLDETFAALGFAPYPKQRAVIDAVTGGIYAVLAGGSAGGGKSVTGRNLGIGLCRMFPNIRIGVFRRTYPELHRTHEIPVSNLPRAWGIWRADPHEFRFDNGSILELGSVERDTDLSKYQSAEYNGLIFDEATAFTWNMITFLNARVRSTDPTAPRFILLLTNPGGESHAEVKATFVDAAEPEERFDARIGESTFPAMFVPFRLEDNAALLEHDPGYRDRILAMPEHLRRAWLYGDWDVTLGSFFDMFLRAKHVVTPFEIPKHWPRWRSMDYGYRAPMGCLWFTRDPANRTVYVYRELYETRLIDVDQAKKVLLLSRDDPPSRFTAADPAVFSKQPNGMSIAQVWANQGLVVIPANNDRLSGWARMRQYLQWDDDNEPLLKIFSTCRNLIRTIPLMQHDRLKPEDLDSSLDDHLVDCSRYGLAGVDRSRRTARLIDFEMGTP